MLPVSEAAPVSAEVVQVRQASKAALVSAEVPPQVPELRPTASQVGLVLMEAAVVPVSMEVAPKPPQAWELRLRQLQQWRQLLLQPQLLEAWLPWLLRKGLLLVAWKSLVPDYLELQKMPLQPWQAASVQEAELARLAELAQLAELGQWSFSQAQSVPVLVRSE